MKKAINFLLLSLIVSMQAFGQNFPSQVWHDGTVFLSDGEVFKGKVKYDLETNIVQVQTQGIETFSSASITYFEIFDEYYGGIRTFYSLPYAMNTDYKVPIFFELLTEGNDVTLLCREYITTDNRGMNGFYGPMYMNPMYGPMIGGSRLAFDFYFLADSEIHKYGQKKRDLLELMDDKSDEVKLYMRKNRLSPDKRGDLLRITAYYNNLKQ